MPYLIDGYNLLYALGRLTPQAGKGALEGARRWLCAQVRLGHGDEADVTVVFDGRSAPPGAPTLEHDHGVRVEYAHGESADDLIESRIATDPSPRLLTVVSDDRRLREAARRRGCHSLGCLDYYESRLLAPPVSLRPALLDSESSARPDVVTPEETERWLREFGDVGDDPLLRDPFF